MLVRLSLAELRWTSTLRPFRADWMRTSAGMSSFSCKLRIMFNDRGLIYTRSLADDPDQCARVFAFLFRSELDRFDRIGEFYRIAFALICLYQGCQNVQLVAFCRTCGGIPQLLHPAQCPLVIGFPSKRALLSVAALKICLRDKPAF